MTSPRIVLKCDPKECAELSRDYRDGNSWHDALAAACYRQAIEELSDTRLYDVTKPIKDAILSRAADLLAEKLR